MVADVGGLRGTRNPALSVFTAISRRADGGAVSTVVGIGIEIDATAFADGGGVIGALDATDSFAADFVLFATLGASAAVIGVGERIDTLFVAFEEIDPAGCGDAAFGGFAFGDGAGFAGSAGIFVHSAVAVVVFVVAGLGFWEDLAETLGRPASALASVGSTSARGSVLQGGLRAAVADLGQGRFFGGLASAFFGVGEEIAGAVIGGAIAGFGETEFALGLSGGGRGEVGQASVGIASVEVDIEAATASLFGSEAVVGLILHGFADAFEGVGISVGSRAKSVGVDEVEAKGEAGDIVAFGVAEDGGAAKELGFCAGDRAVLGQEDHRKDAAAFGDFGWGLRGGFVEPASDKAADFSRRGLAIFREEVGEAAFFGGMDACGVGGGGSEFDAGVAGGFRFKDQSSSGVLVAAEVQTEEQDPKEPHSPASKRPTKESGAAPQAGGQGGRRAE